MLSILRESLLMSDSGVREPLDPSGEVVKTCRKNDSITCVPDGAWKLRVLVVDDDRDSAYSLSMLVNLWGGDARAAYDGVTGWADHAHRLLCDEAGFDYCLIKPIDLDRLRLLLQRERRWLAWSAEESEQTKATGRLEDEFRTEVPALEER